MGANKHPNPGEENSDLVDPDGNNRKSGFIWKEVQVQCFHGPPDHGAGSFWINQQSKGDEVMAQHHDTVRSVSLLI